MSFVRRDDRRTSERVTLTFDHAALTSTTTFKLYKVPTGRKLRVDRVTYINPTGLTGDGTNAFALEVQNGATVIAPVINTDTGDSLVANVRAAGATLAADTFVEATMTTVDANRVLAAADILSAVFTEDGAATLPIGRLVVEGRLF